MEYFFLIKQTESLILLTSGNYLHVDLYSFVNTYMKVNWLIK